MADYWCSKCGSKIDVYYTDPITYVCENKDCSQVYQDERRPRVARLTEDQARAKRPAMYGLPTCVIPNCCTHQPHGQTCLICEEAKAPAKLSPVLSHWRRLPK